MTISMIYFSPTDGTRKIVRTAGGTMAKELGAIVQETDLTKKENRDKAYSLGKEDVLILGLPVYGGRVPALLDETLSRLKGENTYAVVIAVYGNRDYEDALLEMKELLSGNGFRVAAAAAFIGEHSYSQKIAAGRPDQKDLKLVREFARKAIKKITEYQGGTPFSPLKVKGKVPYKPRAAASPDAPLTNDQCTECLACVFECPTGAISQSDPRLADRDLCIKCCACVKVCPEEAKYFDNEKIRTIVTFLKSNCSDYKQPEYFL